MATSSSAARGGDKEKLSARVAFRLSEADYLAYKQKVAESGMTPSEFFRTAVLSNKTTIVARRTSPERQRVVYLMNKASNNINQIAYRLNSDHLAGKLNSRIYMSVLNALVRISDHMKAMVDQC